MKMRVFIGYNPLGDNHKIVSILLPNGDGVVVDADGQVFYLSKKQRKLYKAQWKEVPGSYEFHSLLLPTEGEVEDTKKEIKNGKFILSAGPFRVEYGQIIEF